MKLGFDIDGVVANMPQAMVEYINKHYDLDYTVEVFKDYNVFNNKYVDDDDLNGEIAQAVLDNVIENEEVCYNLEPYGDAMVFFRKIKRTSHSLHFITARASELQETTIDWFRKNKVPFDTIDVVGARGYGNPSTKGMRARSLNLDFFIDDHIKHIKDLYKHKKRWRKGLAVYNRPWNIDVPLDMGRFLRFDNWDGIIRHLGIHKR